MTFTQPLHDQSVPESASVSLTCALSKPNAQVTWLRDGQEIIPDENHEVEADGVFHTLTLPKAAVDDSAEYSVKVGDQETKATLAVEGIHNTMYTSDLISSFSSLLCVDVFFIYDFTVKFSSLYSILLFPRVIEKKSQRLNY